MDMDDVPSALATRLGPEATGGLLQLLDLSHTEAREDVISACTERFERRLVEETSGLRVQMAELGASLRQEMSGMEGRLRLDMTGCEGRLRAEIASGRVEFIKWSFMFWIGQVLTTIGIVSVGLRLLR